ncbi:MAG: selenocysteine-specific translation elongation factor [Alcaligenaceae bacterium]|nr:selenocysteine-specific translation elongation factor [Alcaligenaceae bacterium]
MIIGTAGHIDHGKTTLVKALTGVETDRLKEEQSRGISIELGYAYTPLANDDILGFIDVPGHERLVHTMAAGASGIDFGLLVVAADDGVMPQTHEHLAILGMLGITQGAVAVSKTDRVDTHRLTEVENEIAQLTVGTFLQDMPVFFVSASSPGDPGVDSLREHLHTAAQTMAARSTQGLFRLAIDRVFTLKGHGTVVTGTVHGGALHLDDDTSDIRLMPGGQKVRVRSIHAQNQPSRSALAGQRCALNLGGIDKDAIARGDWIADARCFQPSRNVDVQLRLLPYAVSGIRTWTPLHIHLGASHYLAHAVPLSGNALAAGETGWVQLVFDQPVCAMPGDRYIARDAQARHTVGGGIVLDPNAPQRKRRAPERLAWLQAVATLQTGNDLSALLQQAPHGLDEHQVMRLLQRPVDDAPPPDALWVAAKNGQAALTLILQSHWDALAGHTLAILGNFHERWPDEPGVDTTRLRRMAWPTLPDALWLALRDHLLADGRLARNGPWLHLPGHAVALTAQETELAEKLLPLLNAGGFNPPWVRDMATTLNEDEQRVRHVLLKLLKCGDVYQIVKDLFYHREQVMALTRLLYVAAKDEGVAAAEFRDLTGLGRKRAIQVLEFFNRAGYTRRVQDKHVLRRDGVDFWQQLS